MADDVAAPAPEAEMTDAPAANGAGAEIPGGEGNSAPNVAAGNGGATLAEGQPAAPNAAPAKPRVFKVGDKVSALASFDGAYHEATVVDLRRTKNAVGKGDARDRPTRRELLRAVRRDGQAARRVGRRG